MLAIIGIFIFCVVVLIQIVVQIVSSIEEQQIKSYHKKWQQEYKESHQNRNSLTSERMFWGYDWRDKQSHVYKPKKFRSGRTKSETWHSICGKSQSQARPNSENLEKHGSWMKRIQRCSTCENLLEQELKSVTAEEERVKLAHFQREEKKAIIKEEIVEKLKQEKIILGNLSDVWYIKISTTAMISRQYEEPLISHLYYPVPKKNGELPEYYEQYRWQFCKKSKSSITSMKSEEDWKREFSIMGTHDIDTINRTIERCLECEIYAELLNLQTY